MKTMREKIERELKEEIEKKEIILDAVALAGKTMKFKDIHNAKRLCLRDDVIGGYDFHQDTLAKLELIENKALEIEVVKVDEYKFYKSSLKVVTLVNKDYYCNYKDKWSYIRDIDRMIEFMDGRISNCYDILESMDKPLDVLIELKDGYEAVALKLVKIKTEKEIKC